MFKESTNIELLARDGISVFMFTEDFAYQRLPESSKHYSIARHIIDTKAEKYQRSDHWKKTLCKNRMETIFVRIMDYYWENLAEQDFSIVDVGAQYGIFSVMLAKYIQASFHTNKIYAFDCGIAGKLTEYNIKLNQVGDIIRFEYKAVSNASIPHLVYYDLEHSEDNHIVRRNFVNLSSYVVDGITLDDYFFENVINNNNNREENLIIKIDAQGADPLIFEGMQRILGGNHPPPIIIFEFVPWVCKSIRDPVQFLSSLPKEYMLFDIDAKTDNKGKQIMENDFQKFVNEISSKRPQYTDLLMLHEKIMPITKLQDVL